MTHRRLGVGVSHEPPMKITYLISLPVSDAVSNRWRTAFPEFFISLRMDTFPVSISAAIILLDGLKYAKYPGPSETRKVVS